MKATKRGLFKVVVAIVAFFGITCVADAATIHFLDDADGNEIGHMEHVRNNPVSITVGSPSRDGYTFVSWNTNATDVILNASNNTIACTTIGAGVTRTVYATWEEEEYTITYNLNGGSASNPESYTISDANFDLVAPTKEGYEFTGWTGSNGDTEQTNVTVNTSDLENKTFTANWKPIEYSIEYNLDGGTVSSNPEAYTIEDNDITLNNPTKGGYKFTGWTDNEGTTSENVTIPSGSTGDKSYTANWEIINYVIEYDLDGGNAENPESYTIESDDITLIKPVKEGYKFIGWTGSNGDTPEETVTIPTGSTGVKSYKANYLKEVKLIIRYFDEDGNVIEEEKVIDYLEKDDYTAPESIEIDGYVINKDKMPTNTEGTFAQDDIYVDYYYQKLLKVSFESNGGTEFDPLTDVIKGSQIDISDKNPTKEGYTFEGWYTDEELTIKFDPSNPITEDLVLYAKWNKIEEPKEEPKEESKEETVVPSNPVVKSNGPQTGIHASLSVWMLMIGITTTLLGSLSKISNKLKKASF